MKFKKIEQICLIFLLVLKNGKNLFLILKEHQNRNT